MMEVRDLPIDDVEVSQFNTRKDLDSGNEDSSLDDLASSIKEKGLLNPILVRRSESGRYDLIAGQRRLLACRKIGWRTIPALVRDRLDDTDATAISLIENVHRAEMNPLDKASAFSALNERYNGDINRVSRETGVGAQTIKRYLALLALPQEIRQRISTAEGPARIGSLSMLATTFSNADEMTEAYNKTAGFTSEIQKQIFRQTGGDISKIDELVEQAHEGAFDTKTCHGLAGKMMCEYIPEELAPSVIQFVEEWRRKGSSKEDIKAIASKLKI
jgi:ParB family transcriptional regulator, chromosome partitioning protein